MGVFRLFRHISKRYQSCINEYSKSIQKINYKPTTIYPKHEFGTDACLIDLNAFIHPVCQMVYDYGGDSKNK